MQLFITKQFSINSKDIIINDQRIIYQLFKVLRTKKWYNFYIQSNAIRYQISIEDIQKNKLIGLIIWQEFLDIKKWNIISMFIALPNNHKKIELIVQKLSEIWINNIYFRQSERSLLKGASNKKIERLNIISLEATEQSRWTFLPIIKVFTNKETKDFFNNFEQIWNKKTSKIVFFDTCRDLLSANPNINTTNPNINNNQKHIVWIIWPEWWLTRNDYKIIWWNKYIQKSLWDSILRTETSSIIWWRFLKNTFNL